MSTTTNLQLFKHDNPTTNTDQFDVKKALNENWDKLDANAGEVANKIQALENTTNEKDTSQDTEIEALKAENTLLKSQIPSATVVGDTVHIEDSSNMQCQIAPLGASKQETREGYNKFNIETITESNYIDQDNGSLGSSTLSDTSDYIPVKANTTYTAVLDYDTLTADAKRAYCLFDSEKNYLTGTGYTSSNKGFTVTPTVDGYIRFSYDKSCKNIMFYEGTDTKPYEQYGASPSIEYESPIESVGDNINLIDARYGVDIKTNDQYKLEVLPNTSYTLSLKQKCIVLGTNTKSQHWFKYLDETETVITQGTILPFDFTSAGEILEGTKTFKTPENCKYLILDLSSYNGTPNTLQHLEVKLVKGTSTGAYSPYGQGSIEIYNGNKNFLDFTNYQTFTATNTYYAIKANDFELKSNLEYIFNFSASGDFRIANAIKLWFRDANNSSFKEVLANASFSLTEEELNKLSYIQIVVQAITSGKTYSGNIYPMIRLASDTEDTYIPHKSQTKALYTQQPFRSIGDVKDSFVKVDGVWYEEHRIKELILNGTENWGANGSNGEHGQYYLPTSDKVNGSNNIVSNKFITSEVNSINAIAGRSVNSNIYITLSTSICTYSVTDFKTWLSQNNAKVYYPLTDPLLIPCTPEQVEVLESFNTYKNVTNISSDSIGELEVTYSKDLETLYNNLSQAVLGGN